MEEKKRLDEQKSFVAEEFGNKVKSIANCVSLRILRYKK
jgi:hypothetical protein